MTAVRERDRRTSIASMVKVWDPPIRIFHWTLAAAVLTALVSDEDRTLHEAVGYIALGLIALRTIWGFLGPRHARFASFVRTPRAVLRYLGEIASGHPRRYLGHNPAGGAMILLLMAAVATAGLSGWLQQTDRFFGIASIEDLHRASANLLIALIILHVAGVIFSSIIHSENLVRAMITGRKPLVPTATGDRPPTD